MIENQYYTIINKTFDENEALFEVQLLPDFYVYKGHFPEKAIAPGVCNIQMIKECVENVLGKKLLLNNVSQCRFLALISPEEVNKLHVKLQVEPSDESFKIVASIFYEDVVYVQFKGSAITI